MSDDRMVTLIVADIAIQTLLNIKIDTSGPLYDWWVQGAVPAEHINAILNTPIMRVRTARLHGECCLDECDNMASERDAWVRLRAAGPLYRTNGEQWRPWSSDQP